MILGETTGEDQLRPAGLLLGEHLLDFFRGDLIPRAVVALILWFITQ
jgi:hypothetical protein